MGMLPASPYEFFTKYKSWSFEIVYDDTYKVINSDDMDTDKQIRATKQLLQRLHDSGYSWDHALYHYAYAHRHSELSDDATFKNDKLNPIDVIFFRLTFVTWELDYLYISNSPIHNGDNIVLEFERDTSKPYTNLPLTYQVLSKEPVRSLKNDLLLKE